jgi:hypothetical protein
MNDFERFVHQMWVTNCVEKEGWNERASNKEAYLRENKQYLTEMFLQNETIEKGRD